MSNWKGMLCCVCGKRVLKRNGQSVSQSHLKSHLIDYVGAQAVESYPPGSVVGKCCYLKVAPVRMRKARDPPYSRPPKPTPPHPPQSSAESNEFEFSEPINGPSSSAHDSLDDSSLNDSSNTQTSLSSHSSQIFLEKVKSCSRTDKVCFVCKSTDNRRAIPRQALRQAWNHSGIFIHPKNRVCNKHMDGKLFKEEALTEIREGRVASEDLEISSEQFGEWLFKITDEAKPLRVDFTCDKLSPEDFELLIGFSKENFETLSSHLLGRMRNTENRKIENALGMLLILFRHNLTQGMLSFLFNTTQQVVSEAISSVSSILEETFVPNYLGFDHLSQEELKYHSRKCFTTVLGMEEGDTILASDGTYLNIDKPGNFKEQHKTWSTHKHSNLYKPMLTVLPSGYILSADGLFYADYMNNDAKIMQALLKERESKLKAFVERQRACAMLLDRGFRDCVKDVEDLGVKVFMPELLKKASRFTTEQANKSRQVTMCRWIVESANGRLKNVFRFFRERINGNYRDKLAGFLNIACAMLNAFKGPLFVEEEKHQLYAERYLRLMNSQNALEKMLAEENLERLTPSWRKASAETIKDFPRLTFEQLEEMALGSYQMETSLSYIEDHLDEKGDFMIRVHKAKPNVIRAEIFSRHSKATKYHVWVEYDAKVEGVESVTGWLCKCKTGARTCGMCSHVACVIRYLSLERHREAPLRKRRPKKYKFRDAGNELKLAALGLVPEVESEEEDDDDE